MTRHFSPPRAGSTGAEAVGLLAAVDPLSRRAVIALRRWCDEGAAPSESFARLCSLCIGAAQRPLMRHGLDCPCLGADEAAFAAIVRLAAEGDREEALMIAMAVLRADYALSAVVLAQQAGLMLRRTLLVEGRDVTLH
jgi:hypothetical protein